MYILWYVEVLTTKITYNLFVYFTEHGAHYKMDCNICVCFGGVETCSKRQCMSKVVATTEEKLHFTGLPCDCADQYVPVCGANGQTYPNECLAK